MTIKETRREMEREREREITRERLDLHLCSMVQNPLATNQRLKMPLGSTR